uniref:CCHC-type domain-containing protein n=1 Tax=Myripristis murdjan TaxID=586833 RepID=A0A667YAA5_9TELE
PARCLTGPTPALPPCHSCHLPLDPEAIRQTLSGQDNLLRKHDQLLEDLMGNSVALSGQVNELSNQMMSLTSLLASLTSTPPAPAAAAAAPPPSTPPMAPSLGKEPHTADPEPYSGDPKKCKQFLLQCSLVLGQKPLTYATSESQVQYVVGLLRGKALDWATAVWEVSPGVFKSFPLFIDEFKKVFEHSVQSQEAASKLLSLRQGSRSVAEYSIEFRILAAGSGFNDSALRGIFIKGLGEQLKDELAVRDETATIDSLISLAIRVDERIRERRSPPPAEPEPMQLGRARLTQAECTRRMSSRECLYCGQRGHFIAVCPVRPKEKARSFRGSSG